MGTALNRVLSQSPYSPELRSTTEPELDQGTELALAARDALAGAYLVLASDPDNDGDDDSSESGDTDNDSDHVSHATYKAMVKKGMKPKLAAKMCAKSDSKKVAASMVGRALVALNGLDLPDLPLALSVTQAERDKAKGEGNSLPDGSYPIRNAKQLHSAAVLASSGHGNVEAAKRLIRRRAKELGVDINSLPGFGSSDDDEKVAASMVALAARTPAGLQHLHPNAAMHHDNFHGQHSHPHIARVVINGAHLHKGDNVHGEMLHPAE